MTVQTLQSIQTTSETLFEQAKKLNPGGVNSPVRAFKSLGGKPFFANHGKGAYLTTVDGKTLIDFVGTMGPAIHGHNHPAIKEAIQETLEHGTGFWMPHPHEVTLMRHIALMVPSVEKQRLCTSGTEATMIALRIARGYTGKNKIIKFAGCYHGHVDSLLVKAGSGASCLGCPDSAGVPKAFTGETIVLEFNDIDALETAFKEYHEDLAGVILEPYLGNCGFIPGSTAFLQKLRELCTRYKAVLIFDEVMTGFRLAAGGVQEIENITPDLTAMGKIIGGGLPVGAVGGKAEIMDCLAPLGPVYQAGTMAGNPLAMAGGLTALKLLKEQDPYAQLDAKGRQLKQAILEAAQRKGIPLQMHQMGSMFSFYFSEHSVKNYTDVLACDQEPFKKVFHYCLDNGVFLAPSAFESHFISTAHNQAIMDQACSIISQAIIRL